jgi:hypothetical protein
VRDRSTSDADHSDLNHKRRRDTAYLLVELHRGQQTRD